jgi:transcription antitermination factor NusG
LIGVSSEPEKATALQACSTRRSVFITYCFTRIELQWHSVRQCPGVVRLVRSWGHDEPTYMPNKVIDDARTRRCNRLADKTRTEKPRCLLGRP